MRADQRVLVQLGLVSVSVGSLTAIWELLANQAPYTVASIASLAAPVAQLRGTAITMGLILLAVAWVLPHIAAEALPRAWRIGVVVSVVASLLSLLACASANVMGIQLDDPQPNASYFVYARLVSQGAAGLFLLDLTRRALFSRTARE